MKHTDYLNFTIYDWSTDNLRLPLYSLDIKSNDLEYLEILYTLYIVQRHVEELLA